MASVDRVRIQKPSRSQVSYTTLPVLCLSSVFILLKHLRSLSLLALLNRCPEQVDGFCCFSTSNLWLFLCQGGSCQREHKVTAGVRAVLSSQTVGEAGRVGRGDLFCYISSLPELLTLHSFSLEINQSLLENNLQPRQGDVLVLVRTGLNLQVLLVHVLSTLVPCRQSCPWIALVKQKSLSLVP